MYNYSPIDTIDIKNFRILSEVHIDMKNHPIIALKGDNESGKTSIVKAVQVLGLHSEVRNQKNWIRTGTNGFGVSVALKDGTQVVRIKMPTVNRYTVTRADGSKWEASKLESELPKEVADVMGLTEEPETKEPLQIRTYGDKLLFVETAESANYKVMYNALNVDNIKSAIQAGTSDCNTYKRDLGNYDIRIDETLSILKKMVDVDIEPLVNIKERVKVNIERVTKLESLLELINQNNLIVKKLGALSMLKDAKEIDLDLSIKTKSLFDIYNKRVKLIKTNSVMAKAKELQPIDFKQVDDLAKLLNTKQINSKVERMGKAYLLISTNNLEPISLDTINQLQNLQSLTANAEYLSKGLQVMAKLNNLEALDKIKENATSLTKIMHLHQENLANRSRLEEVREKVVEFSGLMANSGAAVGECSKCGETVVLDVSGGLSV